MGFLGQTSNMRQTPVMVLMPGFQARCTLTSVGLMQTFINDEQKSVFSLQEVSLYGLERGNPAVSMTLPELHVRKDQVHALIFDSALSREESGLLPRTESLAAYTSHYVIQGQFHMGPEAYIADFIDVSKAMFLGVTNAYFFPLFASQSGVTPQAAMAFIHRNAILFHHKV
jgi:hypothetical protein